MLRIRSEQLAALRDAAREGFAERLARSIRSGATAGATAALADAELRARVTAGLARARFYGITWESMLAAFVIRMFTVAPNFDEHPFVRRILRNTRMSGDARMQQLLRTAPAHVWNEARRLADAAAWSCTEPRWQSEARRR